MKKLLTGAALSSLLALSATASQAADYVIDREGQHAFINFKISHLGFSWMYGSFNDFSGKFSWDANAPEASQIEVDLKTASVDTNHAERDKHLRSSDLLNVDENPTARFVSKKVSSTDGKTLDITGDLTLNGVTREVNVDAEFIGEGEDPWGAYRAGFAGTTRIKLKDYNIMMNLGPASEEVELIISFEGIRQ
ncbi:YceI family protein [Marinobacterium sediminicola]|uniref:Polyisoprenoid-binding protein YceI n=1 Tax=Marinobacterium sediminicola TaxID=518898 RepID=A0ABY1S4H8_9GAMM|nr:YceI family protein [Marinobacterium sediminicola]ULG69228.1 YceI family protein [Marinobacterium sediminicola]SMR78319.1 Polyisoprenoid-binding protein YceI [Marinobacterium sediminicola]